MALAGGTTWLPGTSTVSLSLRIPRVHLGGVSSEARIVDVASGSSLWVKSEKELEKLSDGVPVLGNQGCSKGMASCRGLMLLD